MSSVADVRNHLALLRNERALAMTTPLRHDAAYIELPNGKKFILVVFTRGTADDVKLLPAIATKALAELE